MSRGKRKAKPVEERKCLVHGVTAKSDLIRFVVSPEGILTPDIKENLPGRGVWLCPIATKNIPDQKLLTRAFQNDVIIPDNILDILDNVLSKTLISQISLTRKAGYAIMGKEKVHDALQLGKAYGLIQASDGSEREKRNLGPKDEIEFHFQCLTSSELGVAFGRETVIHTVITNYGASRRILKEALRLSKFRETPYTWIDEGLETNDE